VHSARSRLLQLFSPRTVPLAVTHCMHEISLGGVSLAVLILVFRDICLSVAELGGIIAQHSMELLRSSSCCLKRSHSLQQALSFSHAVQSQWTSLHLVCADDCASVHDQ
jgi:hypothetical protein